MIYAPNYVHTFDFVPCKINGVQGLAIYTLDFIFKINFATIELRKFGSKSPCG